MLHQPKEQAPLLDIMTEAHQSHALLSGSGDCCSRCTLRHLCDWSLKQKVCAFQVVAIASTLFSRIRLYTVTARTADAAEQFVKHHVGTVPQPTTQQMNNLITSLTTNLMDLIQELLKSESPNPARHSVAHKTGLLLYQHISAQGVMPKAGQLWPLHIHQPLRLEQHNSTSQGQNQMPNINSLFMQKHGETEAVSF